MLCVVLQRTLALSLKRSHRVRSERKQYEWVGLYKNEAIDRTRLGEATLPVFGEHVSVYVFDSINLSVCVHWSSEQCLAEGCVKKSVHELKGQVYRHG